MLFQVHFRVEAAIVRAMMVAMEVRLLVELVCPPQIAKVSTHLAKAS